MDITSIKLYQLAIPFQQTFSHSSASRAMTETVWVEVCTDNDVIGYGEGCPREYVTGETLDTARTFFDKQITNIVNTIHSVDDLVRWVITHREEIDQNPAVWCAIELALLDALGKTYRQSIEQLLDLPELVGSFQYSAVLGDNDPENFAQLLHRYYTQGFRDFKVKLAGDITRDNDKLLAFQSLESDNVKVRVDANNLWQNANETIAYVRQLSFPTWAIEEPLVNKDFNAMASIAEDLDQRIILDESFLCQKDFNKLGDSSRWIINLRISKMGGLIRSKVIGADARERHIPLIVGAQVGETSVLTRAGLSIANAYSDNVLAREGAFGTWLLKADVVEQPLMMEMDGRLHLPASTQLPGLGLSINLNNQAVCLTQLSI